MNDELDRDLSALAAMVERRALPTRHDARPLLLEIGRRLSQDAGSSADLEPVKRRISGFPPAFAEAWSAAVLDEISMAATEYVRSADPRYLGHPKYDWAYTLEAREHLGWRMKAVQYLGIAASPDLEAAIERADRLLEVRKPVQGPNS